VNIDYVDERRIRLILANKTLLCCDNKGCHNKGEEDHHQSRPIRQMKLAYLIGLVGLLQSNVEPMLFNLDERRIGGKQQGMQDCFWSHATFLSVSQ